MRTSWPLSKQIFALAFVNLVLLLAVFVAFAEYQFHLELGSFLFAPARDRLEAVAVDVSLELQETPVPMRTELLARYAANNEVDFFLFDNSGSQLAGRPVELPQELKRILRGPRLGGPDNRGDDKGGGDKIEDDGKMFRPPPPPPRRPRPFGGPGRGGHEVFQLSAGNMFWAGVRIPIDGPGEAVSVRGTLILEAKSFFNTPLFFDFKPWLAALTAATAIFLLCWLPFIRGITKTISRITRAAEQIGEGDFGRHLTEDRGDELGQLSVAINSMADQLAGFVKGQKRFLGDIAHELCAPIARMQFGLGILDQQAAEAQKPAVADVQEEMGQMSALVGELLSFSKVGMESKERALAPVDVRSVALQAAEREAAPNVRFEVEISEPLLAMADREYLLRSVSNLARNAARYAGEAGPITITARKDRDQIVIQVSDCGPGLPAEELEKIFTPFYRLEAARDREHGGVGLGLAIVKNCVDVCRGQVKCRNRQPSGLEVEIRLTAA